MAAYGDQWQCLSGNVTKTPLLPLAVHCRCLHPWPVHARRARRGRTRSVRVASRCAAPSGAGSRSFHVDSSGRICIISWTVNSRQKQARFPVGDVVHGSVVGGWLTAAEKSRVSLASVRTAARRVPKQTAQHSTIYPWQYHQTLESSG